MELMWRLMNRSARARFTRSMRAESSSRVRVASGTPGPNPVIPSPFTSRNGAPRQPRAGYRSPASAESSVRVSTTLIPWAVSRSRSARAMASVSAFSDLAALLSYGFGTPQSRHPPCPGSMATTMADGLGRYTWLEEPGAGTTTPSAGVADVAGNEAWLEWTDGAGDELGFGSARVQPPTSSATDRATRNPRR